MVTNPGVPRRPSSQALTMCPKKLSGSPVIKPANLLLLFGRRTRYYGGREGLDNGY
jgi:hypothetical protein